MIARMVGLWCLVAGTFDEERHGTDDEGWPCCWVRKVPFVTAAHKRGKVYTHSPATEAEGVALVQSLPETFDAEKDSRFNYLQTTYGSEDWGIEDEMGLMDEEERCRMW